MATPGNESKRRRDLRMALLETIKENGADLQVGLVRAVLGEVEHVLMTASGRVDVCDLPDWTKMAQF